ncbi:MAG TPA: glycosyltransferase [Longimicrobiales bacterium]|nr:glycosyltransferase [Longimicrobiales bacterium]
MQTPAISVILPTWDTFDAVRTTVEHLGRQTVADQIELLICAPGADDFLVDADAVRSLHSVRVLEAGDLSMTGPVRARAVREARASVVAFTEDHSFPDPGWAEALLRAHAEPHAAVAPAIRNANPETAVSWADLFLGYGRWLAPGRRGTMDLLPGHNISYKREVLEEYGGELDRLMEAETVLLWDLRRRGHTLLFEPAAVTSHTNFSGLRVWLDAQWHLGRVFSATRGESWTRTRRLAFALASPVIPLIRSYHIVRYGYRNGVPLGRIVSTAPALLVGLLVDAAAQATGMVTGAGGSVSRLAAYEFHRAEVNRTGRLPARGGR